MAIYIDPPRWPAHGTTFSHMVSDTSYRELHVLASRLGVPERAFDADHYDVPARLYERAVALGAIPVSGRELISLLRTSGLRVPPRERPKYLVPVLMAEWNLLCPREPGLGEELLERWQEGHRHYHNLAHLHEALRAFERLSDAGFTSAAERLVRLALWFHDAVYDGVPGRDEERSAELAEAMIGGALGRDVARLVLLTISHDACESDIEGRALVDSDLAILGASTQRYTRYVQQVRDEYAFVDAEDWNRGRSEVLMGLIRREQIYLTSPGEVAWEAPARANLVNELNTLRVS